MGQDNLDVILHNMERKPEDWHLDDFRARHLVVTHDSEIHLRVSSQDWSQQGRQGTLERTLTPRP